MAFPVYAVVKNLWFKTDIHGIRILFKINQEQALHWINMNIERIVEFHGLRCHKNDSSYILASPFGPATKPPRVVCANKLTFHLFGPPLTLDAHQKCLKRNRSKKITK